MQETGVFRSRSSAQRHQEFSLPTLDVIFANVGKQRLVAGASFLNRHDESLRERTGDRFRIIGVDQQGVAKVDRGAGEAGQDEDARIVRILSSNIFFRNEIYSIAQWVTRPTRAVR